MWPFTHRPIDGIAKARHRMQLIQLPLRYLPVNVDLLQAMPPIKNQADSSACVANAFADLCEYSYRRRAQQHVAVSRLFIYYNGRKIDRHGAPIYDDGATNTNTVLGMRKFGLCAESVWPYDMRLLNKAPPAHIYRAASRTTIVPLKIPRNLMAMKICLANQLPFLISIRTSTLTAKEAQLRGGYISMPDRTSRAARRVNRFHAVIVVGYNDQTRHFTVRNSWGHQWGHYGYFFIPYEYLMDKRLVNWSDGVWAIADILPRFGPKLPIFQLAVPECNHDKQQRLNQTRIRSNVFGLL